MQGCYKVENTMNLQVFLPCCNLVKCLYPSNNFNLYLWNGVLLFQQPLHNHHARLLQLCKVVNILHKLPQPFDNLLTTLSQPYKVTTRLLQPSYFCMGIYVCTYLHFPLSLNIKNFVDKFQDRN